MREAQSPNRDARALLAWQPGPGRRAPRRALLTGAGLSSPVRLALAGLSPPSGSLQASGVSSDGSGDSLWRSPSATRRAVLVRGFLLLCPALRRRRPLVHCLGRRRLWSAGSPSALRVLGGCRLPAGGHSPAASGAGPCSALAGLRRRRRDEPCSALGLLCCFFEGSSPVATCFVAVCFWLPHLVFRETCCSALLRHAVL